MTDSFDNIRPYNDSEVAQALNRLLNNPEFIKAIIKFRFKDKPTWFTSLMYPLVKYYLKNQIKSISTVDDLQRAMEAYLGRVIKETTQGLSVSGLDELDPTSPYLFISNHRDIAVDPAMINWHLYQSKFGTLRVAIGDNLLTKSYVEDLMRLNKSFIVNRSATKAREKLKAAKQLSAYICHSLLNDRSNIWIAQREGRAKDGVDRTNSAVISMLLLAKPKGQSIGDYIQSLNIVPVSISYEWDPCDSLKARELHLQRNEGEYIKDTHEDAQSIAQGITGEKGRVHVAFGLPLDNQFESSEDVAHAIDQQIIQNYRLFDTNHLAYQAQGHPLSHPVTESNKQQWQARLDVIEKQYHPELISMYANPIHEKSKISEVSLTS